MLPAEIAKIVGSFSVCHVRLPVAIVGLFFVAAAAFVMSATAVLDPTMVRPKLFPFIGNNGLEDRDVKILNSNQFGDDGAEHLAKIMFKIAELGLMFNPRSVHRALIAKVCAAPDNVPGHGNTYDCLSNLNATSPQRKIDAWQGCGRLEARIREQCAKQTLLREA